MSCPICCEEFNKSTRKQVTCPKCNESFCSTCVKRYILEEAEICLSCKCEWDTDFLSSNLTKKFIKSEYRDLQRQKLFDMETALLPAAMPLAEATLKNEKLHVEVREVDKKIRELYAYRQLLCDEIAYCFQLLSNSSATKYKPETVSGCPKEGCRGFIAKKNWSCGICDTHICKSCFEILTTDEHTCKQENIDTAKMIMKECKPCPKCSALIYKIEGCDQMYCVQCNTAFSWTTGKIETGRIHNPHYYDWVRQNNNGTVPREPGDNGCNNDRLIEVEILAYRLQDSPLPEFAEQILLLHRKVLHMIENSLQQLRNESDNAPLRVKFLLNRISKEDFKMEIEKRDRLHRRRVQIANVIELFTSVMIENFNLFMQQTYDLQGTKEWRNIYKNFFDEFEKIRTFTNENLANLGKKLNISLKRFII